jgi:hypothetical protein
MPDWRARASAKRDNGTEAATGRLRIETVTTKEGSIRWLYISGCKRIDKRLMRLPIIYADATLPLELTRYYLPRLELALDLVIAEQHGRLVQAIGHPVGKSALQPLPDGKRTPAEEARVARKRASLVDTVRHLTHGRRGLVITYLSIEAEFEGIRGVAIVSSTTCFSGVPSADRVIRNLSLPPFTAPLRTRFSISRCDVTPTCFRNLRIAILKRSSSNSAVMAVLPGRAGEV